MDVFHKGRTTQFLIDGNAKTLLCHLLWCTFRFCFSNQLVVKETICFFERSFNVSVPNKVVKSSKNKERLCNLWGAF